MELFENLLNGCNIIAQGCLQLLFAARCAGRRVKIRHFLIYLPLLYVAVQAAAVSWIPETALLLVLVYGTERLLFRAGRMLSFTAAALAVYASGFSFGAVNSLELLLLPMLPARALSGYVFSVLGECAALTLCAVCYRLISGHICAEDASVSCAGLLLAPGLFFLTVQSFIMQNVYGNTLIFSENTEPGKQALLLMVQLLGLLALFCTLYAYRRTCEGFRMQGLLFSLEQEARSQKRYVEEAGLRYERTRAFRHDIRNHLSVLDGLLKKEKICQAQEYLKKLNLSSGELSLPVNTGNPVVDILLGDKLVMAVAAGLKTECTLVLPKICGVDDMDLCVIFANALDNAIQACGRLKEKGAGWIRIGGERQGDFYLLEFENACDGRAGTPIRPGTGLSNIKSAAEKYGGTVLMERTDSSFCLQVLLDISAHIDAHSGQKA